jgi:hypothetical protein
MPDGPLGAVDWSWATRGCRGSAPRRAAHRGPRAPRQRARAHEPRRPRVPRGAGRVRALGGRALPVGGGLDAGQRAAHHGALQRPLRPLVPAHPLPARVRPRARDAVPGGGARHARRARGEPGRAAGADRRPGPRVRHRAAGRRGGVPERAALARLRPAARARDREHPLRAALEGWGVDAGELDAFVDEPCPPTSSASTTTSRATATSTTASTATRGCRAGARPAGAAAAGRVRGRGGGARVRHCAIGVEPRLREAWARYGRPLP